MSDNTPPHLMEIVKWLSSNGRIDNVHSILNIGMNCDESKINQKDLIEIVFWDNLNRKDVDVTVLEIYEPYVLNGPNKYPNMKFRLGDVREVDKYFEPKSFDAVVWWHGPEHVKMPDVLKSLKLLESIASKYVILGSPEGWQIQGPDGDNHYDSHVSGPNSSFYRSMGYESWALLDPNLMSAVAFKEVK
jgi:hypothetical protein